jgi:putative DNA primase/helicase
MSAAHYFESTSDAHTVLAKYHETALGADGVFVLTVIDRAGKALIYKYAIGDAKSMADEAMERGQDANAYFGVAIMRGDLAHGARGGVADAVGVPGLVLDDDADTGKGAVLPPGIEPTFIVTTSHVPKTNRHIHFVFNRLLTPREGDTLAKLLHQKCGGDHGTKEIAHVWRLPGTKNIPNEAKIKRGRPKEPQAVELTGGSGEAVDPDALRKALEAMPDHAGYRPKSDDDWYHEGAEHTADVDWQLALMSLPESTRFMITSPAAPGTDRSALAASVITMLARLGWSEAKIAAVIRAHPQGIGARYLEAKNNLEADLGRILDKYAQQDGWSKTEASPDDDLDTTAAADVEMRGIEWLWPGRFAKGAFGLIAGLPDMGKGQIAAYLAAAVTAKVELPCLEGFAPQGNVIWFNAEDDVSRTIKPRLAAAGANLDRVHFVNGARVGGKKKHFNLIADLHLLRKAIQRIGNVVLVIIDPVSAYIGVGKVDGRSAADVRGVLTPLKDMAEDLEVAVIGLAHFNKKDDVKSALLRVSDSIAWVAAARSTYVVVDDPEDKDCKLFAKAKNNLARDNKALRYGMGVKTVGHDAKLGVDVEAPHIVWHPQHVNITANEAMEAAGGRTAKREAKEFLLNRLEAGPVSSDDILEEAKQEGIAERTLRRIKKEMGIESYREGGSTGAWFWKLPPNMATTHP